MQGVVPTEGQHLTPYLTPTAPLKDAPRPTARLVTGGKEAQLQGRESRMPTPSTFLCFSDSHSSRDCHCTKVKMLQRVSSSSRSQVNDISPVIARMIKQFVGHDNLATVLILFLHIWPTQRSHSYTFSPSFSHFSLCYIPYLSLHLSPVASTSISPPITSHTHSILWIWQNFYCLRKSSWFMTPPN